MTRNWNARWALRRRANDDRVVVVIMAIALLTVAAEISGLLGFW